MVKQHDSAIKSGVAIMLQNGQNFANFLRLLALFDEFSLVAIGDVGRIEHRKSY